MRRGRGIGRRQPGSMRFAACFVLSLGLHAGLLRTWAPPPAIVRPGGTVLSITLTAPTPPAPPATNRTKPIAPQTQRLAAGAAQTAAALRVPARAHSRAGRAASPAKAKERPAHTVPPAERAPAAVPAPTTTRAATRPASSRPRPSAAGPAVAASPGQASDIERPPRVAAETARTHVRELLLADIARHFEYPWIARRRGWQGMVRLSVTVRPDGALERIHVTRSSGYELLDRSAVETMQRVGQLAHAGHWLDGRALELPLAIVYRLTE